MIKYIVFDLDGTLLRNDKTIAPNTIEKITDICTKKEIKTIIASGRHYNETKKYRDLLIDSLWFTICSDGFYTYSSSGELLFSGESMDRDRIINLFNEYMLEEILLVCPEMNYILNRKPMILNSIRSIKSRNKRITIDEYRKKDLFVEKVIILQKPLDYTNIRNEFNVNTLTNGNVEIMNDTISKWNAIKRIIEKERISIDSIAYFGDDENDLECIKMLQYTFAMGNSIDEVKKNCKYIVGDNEDNGIIEGLQIIERIV